MGVLNTTPRTWVTSEIVTAAEMNAEVRDALTAIQAAGTAWTPTIGGITTTSGTTTAVYQRVGHWIDFDFSFTLGASSAVTGGITITLPVTAARSGWYAGDCGALDSSAATDFPIVGKAISTTVLSTRVLPAVAGNAYAGSGTNSPFTWATGDVISLRGRYEAA